MNSELILSTYNAPRALALSLQSLRHQSMRPSSIAIADDGSTAETREVIDRFQRDNPELRLRHVWHEDVGFRKTVILNKAIASSKAEYLIFSDGDCLFSKGFIARHIGLARHKRYLCGSLIRLPRAASDGMEAEQIDSGKVFSRDWLRSAKAIDRMTTWMKTKPAPVAALSPIEAIWPVRRTWSGSNASGYRHEILAVNGFDETMVWGGEDKEFGIRLANSGVSGRHLRFTAPVLHLDHPRGYVDPAAVQRQREMIKHARESGKTWTKNGINAEGDAR